MREVWVAQPRQKLLDAFRQFTRLAAHFTVVRERGIQEQNRVPGGSRIEYDEAIPTFVHRRSKSAEHRDLLRAWGTKIFFEEGAAMFVEVCAGIGHHLC